MILGAGALLPDRELGEVLLDGLLKRSGLLGADGGDGGEAELTDDLNQRAFLVETAFKFRKQHGIVFLLYFVRTGAMTGSVYGYILPYYNTRRANSQE